MGASESFLNAVKAGDLQAVQAMFADDAGLASLRDTTGVSVICVAVYHRQERVARWLAAQRADLDLFEASTLGDARRVSALLDQHPEAIDAYSPDGFHPLGYACFFGRPELLHLLLERGADLEAPSRNSMQVRAIHSAVAHADPALALELTRQLLEAGASPNAAQHRGFTPLHEAAARGHAELVSLLRHHRADPGAKTTEGKTPADLADERGHAQVAAALRAI